MVKQPVVLLGEDCTAIGSLDDIPTVSELRMVVKSVAQAKSGSVYRISIKNAEFIFSVQVHFSEEQLDVRSQTPIGTNRGYIIFIGLVEASSAATIVKITSTSSDRN
ncbi:MAG: hypothetical protein HC912_04415 [Saprospiraceae bacterium]|nr:hypothetical protein [Saprospiraceae bacterium]